MKWLEDSLKNLAVFSGQIQWLSNLIYPGQKSKFVVVTEPITTIAFNITGCTMQMLCKSDVPP